VLELEQPVRIKSVLDDYERLNPGRGSPDYGTARSLVQALGYHTGFGSKPACRGLEIHIAPTGWTLEEYIRRRATGGDKAGLRATRNKLLLSSQVHDLVETGAIGLERLPGLLRARDAYQLHLDAVQKAGRIHADGRSVEWTHHQIVLKFDMAEKRRHYFIHSPNPNTGKSTFLKMLQCTFRGMPLDPRAMYHQAPTGVDLICIDAAVPGNPTFSLVEGLSDGTAALRVFNVGNIRPDNPIIMIIMSNHPPAHVFDFLNRQDLQVLFHARFFTYELSRTYV